jgi:hypothetical protein
MCDCTIGYLVDKHVKISELYDEVNGIVEYQKRLKSSKSEPSTAEEIIDNRRGYLQRFTYCPDCGYKINWKRIILDIKQGS